MGGFGGLSPYPRKLGGGRSRVAAIFESLSADRGTVHDVEADPVAYVENLAIARALSSAWATNARLATLWDAARMPIEIVVRWERILALAPGPKDTEAARRRRVGFVLARFGSPAIYGILSDALRQACGDAFIRIEHDTIGTATITVPDGSYPFGAVVAGQPWSSTVAHIKVRMTKPASWSEGQFNDAVKQVHLVLAPELPAWCSFEWYRV